MLEKTDFVVVRMVFNLFGIYCPFTLEIKGSSGYENLSDIFNDEKVHKHFLSLTRILKIPIGRM